MAVNSNHWAKLGPQLLWTVDCGRITGHKDLGSCHQPPRFGKHRLRLTKTGPRGWMQRSITVRLTIAILSLIGIAGPLTAKA